MAVLVATLGSEPQVVTLALDLLLQAAVPIERVVVAHTLPDEEPIRSSLERLHEEFLVKQHYGAGMLFAPHLLAGASGPLKDVTTSTEIEDAFQSLYTLLRQHKQAGRTIHLSIAGGRKTMTLFAMAAAQIVLAGNDRVWHIVSSPRLVASKSMHAQGSDDAGLVAVPIAHWGRSEANDRSRAAEFIHHVLTPAEREVTELLVREGLSNAALAKRLDKSIKTIANQLSSVYVKLADYYDLQEPADRALLLVLLGTYT